MADFEHILLNILENKSAKYLENSAKCAYKPIFSYSIKNSILQKMSLTTFLHSADDLLSFLCLYTIIVTLLAKNQLYELTIIAAYEDMYNYYRPVVPKLLIIV